MQPHDAFSSFSGVEDSPFMTWGEIEGTPFRLDGGDTPLIHKTPGPIFKIPETPQRDRLAHELADKVGASHRAKKEKALSNARASLARYSASVHGLNSAHPTPLPHEIPILNY